jgi:hypothetical protein
MSEKIICAAIYIDDGKAHMHQPKNIPTGFVIAGRRHHNCIYISTLLDDPNNVIRIKVKQRDTQGFLTSEDRFVGREEALIIAKRENQVIQPELVSEILISEDLY